MREVPIRQFQQHLYDEIQDLPFVVTRKGKPAFVVVKPPTQDLSTIVSIEVQNLWESLRKL